MIDALIIVGGWIVVAVVFFRKPKYHDPVDYEDETYPFK
jgi:hypothetical protein